MIRYILKITVGFRNRIALSAIAGIIRVGTGLFFVALSKHAVDIAIRHTDGSLTPCIIGLVCAIIVELICSSIVNRTMEL